MKKERHWNWKGGRSTTIGGYTSVYVEEGHPERHNGHVLEHRLIAEKALGRVLPKGAVVFHIDKQRDRNTSDNLVICQSHGYVQVLARRERSYRATGNPNFYWCRFCQTWSPKEQVTFHRTETYHASCMAAYRRSKRGKHT